MDNEPTNVYESRSSVIPCAVIGVVVGGLIGVFVGMSLGSANMSTKDNDSKGNDYQAGFEAARAKLIARGMIMDTASLANTETTYINGTVKAVSGNSLTIEIVPMDPLADNVERTITITPNTTLSLLVNKTPEQMQVDMEAFNAKAQTIDNPASITEFPAPYIKKTITVKDIKAGSMINVNAATNITPTGNIEAVTIEVQDMQVFAPGTPPLPTIPAVAN